MKVRAFRILVTLLVLFVIYGNAYAQDIQQTRNTLRGLSGVYVMPENPQEEDAIRGGLAEDAIRTDVELELFRLAGIRVLSRQ